MSPFIKYWAAFGIQWCLIQFSFIVDEFQKLNWHLWHSPFLIQLNMWPLLLDLLDFKCLHQMRTSTFLWSLFLPESYFSGWQRSGFVALCVCQKCCGKGDVVLCGIWIPDIPVWEREVDQGRWGKERNTSGLEGRKACTSNCASLCLLCDKDTVLGVFMSVQMKNGRALLSGVCLFVWACTQAVLEASCSACVYTSLLCALCVLVLQALFA